jgi:hypothetical protein
MWVEDATGISPELYDEVPKLAEGAGHLGSGGLSPEGRSCQGCSEEEDEKDARRTEAAHGVPFRKATPERAAMPVRAGLTSHMVPRDD